MDHHKSLTRRTQTLAAQMAFVCGICSASGFTQQAKTNGVDWKALATQMEKALGGRYSDCDENSRGIAVMNTADIGFPVALVSYCHMGVVIWAPTPPTLRYSVWNAGAPCQRCSVHQAKLFIRRCWMAPQS
jgi:hypothetical protein